MAVTFGFYNSLNGDRKYNARDMNTLFDGLINDGIFMSIGDKMMVTAAGGMTVNVGIGRAWFNRTWTYNDAILPITLDQSEIVLNRVDAIILEVDSSDAVRKNSIKIKKGTPATNPSNPPMVKSAQLNQYPLAYIRVNKLATAITQANITNAVGTTATPFVTGIIQTMNIDALISQWGAEWNEWNDEKRSSFLAWIIEQQTDFQNWRNTQEGEFIAWYDMIKDMFGQDAAGHIILLMGDLSELLTDDKTDLVGAINELFTNVSDAKVLIAAELTDKKIHSSSDDKFEKLSTDIRQVRSIGSTKKYSTYELMMRYGFDPIRAFGLQ